MPSEHKQWSVKHRPRTLLELVGNAKTKDMLTQFIKQRSSHAILISGPSGCGKTTAAKIIAKKFSGGHSANVQEFNFGAEGGKEEARRLIEGTQYRPLQEEAHRVFVCEESHGLTKQGTAALLRPVEEPPHNQLLFIFLTDRPWMLDTALLTRCRKFPIDQPNEKELARYLFHVMRQERALRFLTDKEERYKALRLIARYSGLVPREAVQLLQNVHEAELKDMSQLKEFVITARQGSDQAMDAVAAIVITSIFSPDSADKRVTRLVRAYAEVDPIGLLNRVLFALHALLLFALSGKFNYVVKPLLKELGSVKPKIEDMSTVLEMLGRTRNQLREIAVDPSTIILPLLLSAAFEYGGGNKRDKE